MAADDLERFRTMVLADPVLQARLREGTDPAGFAPRLVHLARERGCAVAEAEVESALHAARRSWLERWVPEAPAAAGSTGSAAGADLAGWLPIALGGDPRRPTVDWCWFGDVRLSDPFFDHTVERCLRDPFRLLFRHRTGIDQLLHAQRTAPGPVPSGFVFHMSRCGSTLAAQMLAELPSVQVISEASIVESVLAASGLPADQCAERLRAVLGVLGRPRHPGVQHAVVKFDSWHPVHLPVIRRAFPEVPWVFLCREPLEVLVALDQVGGARLVPGAVDPADLGLTPAQARELSSEDNLAAVLAAICRAALRHHEPLQARVVDHRDLPAAVWQQLPDLFRLPCTDDDRQRMQGRAGFDGKQPERRFVDDRQRKRQAASPELRAAAERWLAGPWQELQRLRSGGGAGQA